MKGVCMAVTLREIRQTLSRKLGGFNSGTVSLAPDSTDALAQRSILSSKLYDADKGTKGFSGHFVWIGKYGDERRVRESGYRALPYVVYAPPTSGTYTLTAYGYGTTSSLAYNASTATVASAMSAIGNGIGTVSVTEDADGNYVVALSDIIDVELSAGTVLASGSIGALEVNRAFTRALQIGDEWELHAKLPVEDSDEVQGLNWCINFAARKLFTIDKFPITPVRNVTGAQTYIGLTGESWLRDRKQIIAVYEPVEWEINATLTPPASGSFVLSIDNATATGTTGSLDFAATGQDIQDELDGLGMSGLTFTVSPLTSAASYTITVERTWYAQLEISTTSGTIAQTATMLQSPRLYPNVWNFGYDAEKPYLDNMYGQEGRSFLVEAVRQSHTWVCRQSAYGTLGSIWSSSTDGLTDDYDQIDVLLDDIVAVAYAYACDQLASVGPGSDRGYWADEAKKAHRVAAGIKMFDMPIQEKPGGNRSTYVYDEAKGFFR